MTSLTPFPGKAGNNMFGLSLLCCLHSQQLSLNFVIPAHSADHLLQGTADDGGQVQTSALLDFADVLQVSGIQSDSQCLTGSVHVVGAPKQTVVCTTSETEQMSKFGQLSHQGAKANTALSTTVNPVTFSKVLPAAVLDELYKKHATFIERVMARLSEAERREINTHLRQDYRQAWICVSFASKNSTQPFVESSYACYGVHPSKVWERILADRHERLGKEYYDWYTSDDLLRPDVPKIPPANAVSHTAIEAAADGTDGGLVPLPKDKEKKTV